jgi:uncharacterized protein (TIGR02466 family)
MVVDREIARLFPSAIQISKVQDADELNKKLVKAVAKIRKSTPNGRPDSWISSVYTTLHTNDKLHLNPEIKDLADIVMDEAKEFGSVLGLNLDLFKLEFKDFWMNIYGWKDGQEAHLHNNSVISGSYYLKAPAGSSGLVFHSPTMDTMYMPTFKDANIYNTDYDELSVEEGVLVLFPSGLKYSVRPSKINKERISLSFNIIQI